MITDGSGIFFQCPYLPKLIILCQDFLVLFFVLQVYEIPKSGLNYFELLSLLLGSESLI